MQVFVPPDCLCVQTTAAEAMANAAFTAAALAIAVVGGAPSICVAIRNHEDHTLGTAIFSASCKQVKSKSSVKHIMPKQGFAHIQARLACMQQCMLSSKIEGCDIEFDIH